MHLPDSLQQCLRMEVLSINMTINVRLLIEFVMIEVLNTNSNLSRLLHMETVRKVSQVRIQSPHSPRESLLQSILWIKHSLNHSSLPSVSQVSPQWPPNLSLIQKCPMNVLIQ